MLKEEFHDTKTKHNRNIPITPRMREELQNLLDKNGDGYVFSDDGGKKPIGHHLLYEEYYRALEKIGMENIPDNKVQSIRDIELWL